MLFRQYFNVLLVSVCESEALSLAQKKDDEKKHAGEVKEKQLI